MARSASGALRDQRSAGRWPLSLIAGNRARTLGARFYADSKHPRPPARRAYICDENDRRAPATKVRSDRGEIAVLSVCEYHLGRLTMVLLARFLRALAKQRFRLLGLATIKDIPTASFRQMIDHLAEAGWRKTSEHDGFDAWIEHGRIRMKRHGSILTLEWDNWTEGSIEGPRATIEEIGREQNLRVTHEWRWSEYDELRPHG